MGISDIRVWILAVWWGTLPLVYGIIWTIVNTIASGMDWAKDLDNAMMAIFWSHGPLFWIWLSIGLIVSAVIMVGRDETTSQATKVISIVLVIGFVFGVAQTWRTLWDADKDFGRYYAAATVFYTPDLDAVPSSLSRLVDDATRGDGDCALSGAADVPSCIQQGTLPDSGWDARIGSLEGAKVALSRSTGDNQRVSLNESTLAYLNESDGKPARWSGILDGSGINVPMGGVAEWSGEGQPTQCLFQGDYAVDRAFGGSRMNNLNNLLAETYPSMRYNIGDAWGYCDGEEPIVVVPMTRQVYFADRTVDTAAGVVTVRGKNGTTDLEYFASVTAGQFPGPVYPASLVATQREATKWAAGRENMKRNGFGYEPADSDAQAGNVSEYLLRDKQSGRLVWVTPLTLRDSSSQLFVAYAISYADEVTDRSLNQLSIYVLADNDPRRINIDNLQADALNYLANNAGTFRSNDGRLVEFTPVDGNIWRAFGELNGRVVYQLDISADASIAPTLVNIDPQATQEENPTEPADQTCTQPASQLSSDQLIQCAQDFLDELAARQAQTD